ncbi:MAG: hypothetical protein IT376_10440 [Polyangiaceae bacterium]|nr:hypothetical protein [Polyangiaceae bacterium]
MADDPDDTRPESAPLDALYVHGPTPDGAGKVVLRAREDRLEIGAMRPVRDGQPLHGEVVRLRPRADTERWFDVEVVHAPPALPAPAAAGAAPPAASGARRKGPARVSSDGYRAGWDAIFGRPDRSSN